MCSTQDLFLCLQRMSSEILDETFAPNTVFGEISMVFHIKGVSETITSVTAEQRYSVEYVSYELQVLKNDLRFIQRHSDPFFISRNLSESFIMYVQSYAEGKLGIDGARTFAHHCIIRRSLLFFHLINFTPISFCSS